MTKLFLGHHQSTWFTYRSTNLLVFLIYHCAHSFCLLSSTDRHTNTHTHTHWVITHTQQKMLYIWLTAQNVGNKEYVLLSHGNLPYQILKTHEIIKHFIEKCNDPRVPFMYLQFLIWIFWHLHELESLPKDDIENLLLKTEIFGVWP